MVFKCLECEALVICSLILKKNYGLSIRLNIFYNHFERETAFFSSTTTDKKNYNAKQNNLVKHVLGHLT